MKRVKGGGNGMRRGVKSCRRPAVNLQYNDQQSSFHTIRERKNTFRSEDNSSYTVTDNSLYFIKNIKLSIYVTSGW